MKKNRILAFCICAGLSAAMPLTAFCEESATEAAADENQLLAPENFTIDPNTGEWSFTAADDRVGYYFIRFYALEDGVETGQYVASSKRINGGKTGEYSGTIDLSDVAWGTYHINLTSFAPAGTSYESPEPVTVTVQYGAGLTLERPEMLVMTSGNQAELVVDWWTLCDYNFLQYMPEMKFTFYSDAECTQEVLSDTVDLNELTKTRSMNPPGLEYIWGWSTSEGPHFYTVATDSNQSTFAFKNDIYTYTLDAGTYYVTAQALSKDEYTEDSQVSSVVEITLTDGEVTEEFESAFTELWADPQLMDMPGSNPGQQPDRIDTAEAQGISALIIE
jgi:hypothetical protein